MMRISTNQIQQQSVNAMLRQQSELVKTQLQISTGERLQSPSDDPVAAVRILGLERDLNLTEQYMSNADVADNKLSVTDGVLTGAVNILQRIRELAVQGLNDTNADARAGIAAEINQLNEALVSLANTTDANGEFLFSGYQSNTQAFDPVSFAYNGDSGQRNVRVGSGYLVEVSEPGDQVFVTTNLDGSTQAIFQTIQDFTTALNNNTIGTAPDNGDFLTNMDTALDSVFSARTKVGTRMNAIDQQRAINEASTASLETNLSQLKDLDYAEAVSRLSQQSTGLQAAQQAYVRVQGLSLFNFL
ncbi:flagellar hook-associated protein FlgL [Methylophaga sp. OBS4]|uniref:flagellar hook-associated protein FlgL n=1 Tax=Methylophaga sp. OBS4 TaxID=2991935 RepID=UPI00224EE831|nr:flagellar hook-associated protein FlgL [Methylophaga sp. OBS4]MCX4187361.1 flagellar hook-associated protein FlgL [Methylophaga sp. OBS4]